MKFEQINEKQIRCTIEPDDFQKMNLSIQDLAYGNERTKKLFRELLDQASDELDFHTDDSPLIIEATPLAENTVSLLITRVSDPDELDTRFARLSDNPLDDDENDFDFPDIVQNLFERADEILDMFSNEDFSDTEDRRKPLPFGSSPMPSLDDFSRIFRFPDLDQIGEAARALSDSFHGRNSVYKDEKTGEYLLILHKDDLTPEEFNAVCNRLSEYSDSRQNQVSASYYMEHFEPLIADRALDVLANL